MVPVVVQPQEIKDFDVDELAIRVFLKALELLGGPRKLILYRNLTWLTSLMEAAYAVVLAEEALKTEDDIAEFLGLTRQTVRNILRADPELVMKKLSGELEERGLKAHTAGGLAKLAYEEIKKGNEALVFFSQVIREGGKILGIGWPAEVLARIKGLDFPLPSALVSERLRGLIVKERDLGELVAALGPEIRNPRELLHLLAEKLREET
ncbi:bacterio-opsin activator [Thermosulfuriphilus ammonigenes]|uniref:Bacterio-opsin activator n=1 Tax=Thermosulfuriphilus ammonigenes TaxID=1936021 RepID=A0A6G7PXJ2_9BACT|nr:bacterio-opsin activator [Thermosulfuriphilus ammonigenes]MBA2849333.1 putative regulatory domain-containing protein [Thermosulfuriphilus ammonigenes]QIJ72409.1 bacterio-opsin activator [Thermosulfuriphilus ammonigenes]